MEERLVRARDETEHLGSQIAGILDEVRQGAVQIRADAREQAELMLTAAQEQAERTISAANAEAATIVQSVIIESPDIEWAPAVDAEIVVEDSQPTDAAVRDRKAELRRRLDDVEDAVVAGRISEDVYEASSGCGDQAQPR